MGKFVVIVEGANEAQKEVADPARQLPLAKQVDLLITQKGLKTNAAIKEVAKANGLKKQVVYNEYHQI